MESKHIKPRETGFKQQTKNQKKQNSKHKNLEKHDSMNKKQEKHKFKERTLEKKQRKKPWETVFKKQETRRNRIQEARNHEK